MDFKKELSSKERDDMIHYIIKNTLHTKKQCEQWGDHNLQILYFKAMYNR